jgi:Trk K+ transport system NAD-binding subunit/nucleotide-binding universal stress UspA family protein
VIANRHIIIVGAGEEGKMFLEELPATWTVTLIDQDPDVLAGCPDTHAGQTIDKIPGDATSRLVLERAKLSERTMVAVMTGQDAVNLEVVRMLRAHFRVETMVCMLDSLDSEAIERAGLRSNEAVHRVRATARSAISHLSETRSQSLDLLLQRGEVRVIQVLPGSAAIGRPLKDLQPRQWLAAAVYRGDTLIVPHGETVLATGDRVMLVGEPTVIDSVALFIHGSEPSFPGQYGANIALIADGEVARSEAQLLHEQTLSDEMITLDPEPFDPRVISKEDIALAIARRQIGMVVVDDTTVALTARLGLRRSTRQRFIAATRVPVLVARSGRPYKRILIAIGGDQSLNAIAIVGIDLARLCEAELTVLTVVPPALSSGEETRGPLLELPKRVASLAEMHGLEIGVRVEEGNPIERIRSIAADYDLIVVGYSQRAYNTIITPDVSLHLLHKTPCSVVFVPWNPAGR